MEDRGLPQAAKFILPREVQLLQPGFFELAVQILCRQVGRQEEKRG